MTRDATHERMQSRSGAFQSAVVLVRRSGDRRSLKAFRGFGEERGPRVLADGFDEEFGSRFLGVSFELHVVKATVISGLI